MLAGVLLVAMAPFQPIAASDLLREALGGQTTTKLLGKGNTGAATQIGAEGLLANPASLAHKGPFYTYETLDLRNTGHSNAQANFVQLGVFGLGFTHFKDTLGNEVNVTAFGYGNHGKAVDWGLSYQTWTETQSGVQSQAWGTDLGVVFHPAPILDIGAVAHHFLASENAPQLAWEAGWTLQLGPLQWSFSGDYTPNPARVMTHHGLEFEITPALSVRTGWMNHVYTLGATLEFSIFNVSYAALYPESGANAQYMLALALGKDNDDNANPQQPRRRLR